MRKTRNTFKANRGQLSYGQTLGILLMKNHIPFIPGDAANASTFPFPVHYETVQGASAHSIYQCPDPGLVEAFIEAGQRALLHGVRAITGNCGFMILFQDQLAAALPAPVFMSSLLQLPLISRFLKPGEKVGIITTNSSFLTEAHLLTATKGTMVMHRVIGLEDCPSVQNTWLMEKGELDVQQVEQEITQATVQAVENDSMIRAILLECTSLPAYSAAIHRAVGLPVFDFFTLAHYVHTAAAPKPFYGLY